MKTTFKNKGFGAAPKPLLFVLYGSEQMRKFCKRAAKAPEDLVETGERGSVIVKDHKQSVRHFGARPPFRG